MGSVNSQIFAEQKNIYLLRSCWQRYECLMKYIFLALIIFNQSVFANNELPLNTRATNFYEALMISMEQKYRAKEMLADWKKTSLEFENKRQFNEKNGCYKKSEGDVLLVLQVEKDGRISKVYSSKENQKSKCFIKTYERIVFPKPPIFPAYLLQRML